MYPDQIPGTRKTEVGYRFILIGMKLPRNIHGTRDGPSETFGTTCVTRLLSITKNTSSPNGRRHFLKKESFSDSLHSGKGWKSSNVLITRIYYSLPLL